MPPPVIPSASEEPGRPVASRLDFGAPLTPRFLAYARNNTLKQRLPQLGQLHALFQDRREEIADLGEAIRHRAEIELLRVELLRDLFPLQWCGYRRAVDRPRRIRRDDSLAVRVLHAIEIEPSAALRQTALDRELGNLRRNRPGEVAGELI